MNVQIFAPIKYGAILIESIHNGEQLFFHCGVVALSRSQLLAIESNRHSILHDYSSQLIITSICVDVEWLIGVRISNVDITGQNSLCLVKGGLMTQSPLELRTFSCEFMQRLQNITPTWEKFPVESNSAYEAANITDVLWSIEFEDGLNLFLPRFMPWGVTQ